MKLGWKSGVFKVWDCVGRRERRVASRRRWQPHRQTVEILEARALLATTYQAVASGSIKDLARDGTPDSIETVHTGLVNRSASAENRAIAEFSIGGEAVNLAVLDFTVGVLNAAGNQTRQFDVYIYGGDGQLSLGDFNASGSLVGMATLEVPLGYDNYRLDVTSAVQQVVGSGNSKVGVRLASHDDTFPGVLSNPTLTINGVATWRGLRGWETTKSAILADGSDSFRLEVDAGGAVNSVELDVFGTRLIAPGTGRITLRDDGLGGDRVAGDYVFTSDEFRYNTAYPMSSFYGGTATSVAGIESIAIGTIYLTELDGTEVQTRHVPEVGIVSPSLSVAAATQLSSKVQVTPHLVNINSAISESQSMLRQMQQLRISELTNQVYSVLPDEFDFLTFLSSTLGS